MDYSTLIIIIVIVLFMFLMHRGGGGCCGRGGHAHGKKDPEGAGKSQKKENDHEGHCG